MIKKVEYYNVLIWHVRVMTKNQNDKTVARKQITGPATLQISWVQYRFLKKKIARPDPVFIQICFKWKHQNKYIILKLLSFMFFYTTK